MTLTKSQDKDPIYMTCRLSIQSIHRIKNRIIEPLITNKTNKNSLMATYLWVLINQIIQSWKYFNKLQGVKKMKINIFMILLTNHKKMKDLIKLKKINLNLTLFVLNWDLTGEINKYLSNHGFHLILMKYLRGKYLNLVLSLQR